MALYQSPDHAERAIAELCRNGFTEQEISLVVFSALAPTKPEHTGLLGFFARGGPLGDTIDRADGVSVMDGTSVGAVLLGLVGLVFGSRWQYGPIAGSTLGMLVGGLAGFLLDRLIPERRREQLETALMNGLILVEVESPAGRRVEMAKRVLRGHHPKQMADLPAHDDTETE